MQPKELCRLTKPTVWLISMNQPVFSHVLAISGPHCKAVDFRFVLIHDFSVFRDREQRTCTMCALVLKLRGISKDVADKLAFIKGRISGNSPNAVQILLAELQTALQEVEACKKIEETLKQQVKDLEPNPFSRIAQMQLSNLDWHASHTQDDNKERLKKIHDGFSKALDVLHEVSPSADISELSEWALKLGQTMDQLERYEEYTDANCETQLNHQKKRAAFHRNRANVLRHERNIAQSAIAMFQKTALLNNSDEHEFREAKASLDMIVGSALMQMQALNAQLETPPKDADPEDEEDADDAADAAEDENTEVKVDTFGLDELILSFHETVRHAEAAGKTLQAMPGKLYGRDAPSETVFTFFKKADERAWNAEKKLRTCNEKLQLHQQQGPAEKILLDYLEIAKTNIASGQALIERIESLEEYDGSDASNGSKKRKRSPGPVQELIRRFTEELAPSVDLADTIADVVSILGARMEQEAEDPSPEERPLAGEIGTLNGILGMNVANLESGQTLIYRIAELEAQIEALLSGVGAPDGGDKDCPKKLEKAKIVVRELTKNLHEAKAELINANAELAAAAKQIKKLEDIKAMNNNEIMDSYHQHDKYYKKNRAMHDQIATLKLDVDDLKGEAEQLKKKLKHAERDRDQCYTERNEALIPELENKDIEIVELERRLNSRDRILEKLDGCNETKDRIYAELEAYRAVVSIPWNDMLPRGNPENYQALQLKIFDLKKKLETCEEAQGTTNDDGDSPVDNYNELYEFDQPLEEYLDLLRTSSKEDLMRMLVNRMKHHADALASADELAGVRERVEKREQDFIKDTTKANYEHQAELNDARATNIAQNDKIRDFKDELRNLKYKLDNCREFKANILKLGIDEPESPRDLEGLDNETLRVELIALQKKLTALGIKYEEAVRNDQSFYSASELEELEFQNPCQQVDLEEPNLGNTYDAEDEPRPPTTNPAQQIRDLQTELKNVRTALKDCLAKHNANVPHPDDNSNALNSEEDDSEDVLQDLRDQLKDTEDKLEDCEKNNDDLIAKLKDDLAEKQQDAADAAAFQARINNLEKTISQLSKSKTGKKCQVCAEKEKTTADYEEWVEARYQEILRDSGRLEAELTDHQQQLVAAQEALARSEAELKEEKKLAASFKAVMNKNYADLLKERQISAKCNELLLGLKAKKQHNGLGMMQTRSRTSKKQPAKGKNAADDDDEPVENLDDCVAEVMKLRHRIAGLEVDNTRLRHQLNVDELYDAQEGHQQQGSGDNANVEQSAPPNNMAEGDDFDLQNSVLADEIETLNNQITAQKEKITALEQQIALDKQEIAALKHSNTDKSKAYQEFQELIEQLRAELGDLQKRLTECKSLLLPLIEKRSNVHRCE